MSNKAHSKQHGVKSHNSQRPKSKLRIRRNKANASVARTKRQTELKKLLAS